MGNCLVTKLKRVVNNDNLDILGEADISIAYTGSQTAETALISIQKKPTAEKLTIEFDTPIYEGDYADSASPINLTLDGVINPYFAQKEGDATVKIKSVYDIKALRIQRNMAIRGAHSLFGFINWFETPSIIDNLSDFSRNMHLIGLYCYNPAEDVVNNLGDKTKIKSLCGFSGEAPNYFSGLSQCVALQIISGTGNIEYLPAAIREIWCDIYSSGAIETFVSNMRAGGRAAGVTKMHNLGYAESVTYGEQRITEYFTAQGLTKGEENYVKWDASNIYILDSQPADYVAPETIYNFVVE